MLFLFQVYHKVSSFLFPASLHTCSLQCRLALSVSDANVNTDHITSKTRRTLFLIATLRQGRGRKASPHFRYNVISDANLDQLRCFSVFRDVGTEEKREGFIFGHFPFCIIEDL